ncbi:MAG: L,D-transpeptidase family protein, partial [candidate division KSB1 bacterium]|jgi:murein L,D-transpeptidase YcbB/YkuD|nr:L,D-transpeptidase family protein [candidate division KSB1 bacterium]
LLTDAFLIYGAHLLAGRINPQTIDAEWFANIRETDLAEVLENACRNKDMASAFERLMPPQEGYSKLKSTLREYRLIASTGGWTPIPGAAAISTDESGKRILDIKERLKLTKDLSEDASRSPYFSKALEDGIRKFQMRHGLEVTGIIDGETLSAMNVPVQERILQIEVNLERWRWLPQNLGFKHLIVNIANFELDIVEDDQIVNTMRVIVGKTYRRTPVFSDKMTYLVMNPYWHVPDNIARQDILPMIKKDQSYLTNKSMRIFDSWGADAREIEAGTLNWSEINTRNFRFRLRQDPGPENALGRIKFMFPNQFNVYLHDTPSRELFLKTNRDFSSGCIRIEKPVELAEYVLKEAGWNKHKIEVAFKRQVEQAVKLPTAVDVHLLYWTCWVDNDGKVNFRRDIYQRDKLLTEALQEEPPGLH